MAAERQAAGAADEEARQLQEWHAEKAVREAEQQAARDAAAAERAARWEAGQAARRERREARREEEAHMRLVLHTIVDWRMARRKYGRRCRWWMQKLTVRAQAEVHFTT